jgi:hypothetical protein
MDTRGYVKKNNTLVADARLAPSSPSGTADLGLGDLTVAARPPPSSGGGRRHFRLRADADGLLHVVLEAPQVLVQALVRIHHQPGERCRGACAASSLTR